MTKKLLAALVCAVLLMTLLPKTARAANATSVSIWGVSLGGTNLYYHNGSSGLAGTVSSRPSTNANATFNPNTNPPTLTLNGLDVRDSNATISGTGISYAIYANGNLEIDVIAASEVSSITNANSYAVYVLGDLTFKGTEKLVATADNDANAAGVYVGGNLEVKSGALEGRVGIVEGNKISSYGVQTTGSITVDGGTLVGEVGEISSKTMSYGVFATATLTVESGTLEGRSGAVSPTSNPSSSAAMSAGVNANDVLVTGGTLNGNGNAATASYALSYGLCTKTLDMRGGIIEANSGAAAGSGGGAYSAGIAVNGALSVSGGNLTAQGDPATESSGATAQSSGVYAEAESISFSGGTVVATGGGGSSESYGIKNAGVFDDNRAYKSGGAITVSGTAVVTATCGETMNNSYGLYCRGGGLTVSGGTLNATSGEIGSTCMAVLAEDSSSKITVSGGNFTAIANTDSTGAYALSKKLETGVNITAKGSTSRNGSSPVSYVAASNFGYKWVSAKPAVTSVLVNPASVSVQKGGTQNFNATVMGADPAQTVSWAVEGGVTDTRIEPNGALTIAANETATSLTVRATSTVNTAISGTAIVTVTTAYAITQGQNGQWMTDIGADLSFTANGEYSQFTGVSVDGASLSSSDYNSRSGSTIITLKTSYLETLAIGRHTLRVNFPDGYAETYFTVAAQAADVPKTGDSATPVIWLGLALVACAGLAVSMVLRRRRQNG